MVNNEQIKHGMIYAGIPLALTGVGIFAGTHIAKHFKKSELLFGLIGAAALGIGAYYAMPVIFKPTAVIASTPPVIITHIDPPPAHGSSARTTVAPLYKIVFANAASSVPAAKAAIISAYNTWKAANPTYQSNAENGVWKYDTNAGGGTLTTLTISYTK